MPSSSLILSISAGEAGRNELLMPSSSACSSSSRLHGKTLERTPGTAYYLLCDADTKVMKINSLTPS
jgi:hypothetical protein